MAVTYYFVSGAYVSFHYSDDDFGSSCQNISPSQDYTHLNNQTKLLHVALRFKPFIGLNINWGKNKM